MYLPYYYEARLVLNYIHHIIINPSATLHTGAGPTRRASRQRLDVCQQRLVDRGSAPGHRVPALCRRKPVPAAPAALPAALVVARRNIGEGV